MYRCWRVASDLRSAVYASSSRDDAAYWTRGGDRLLRGGRRGVRPSAGGCGCLSAGRQGTRPGDSASRECRRAGAQEWLLRNVTRVRLDGDTPIVEQVAVLPLEPDFDADQIYTLINADYALAPLDLIAYIRHLHGNDLDAHRYEVLLWQMLSLPLGLVAMGLLGLPVVVGSTRSLSLGARIAIGGAVGIGFYLLERLLTQLALLYRLSPPLTGLLPDLVALGVAVWLILSRE
ncbi:MAG: LptF/LptG family permease [Pseudomonadales bacterium]